MANPAIQLYNFYKRYKWTANDFGLWQQGLLDTVHGFGEGMFGPCAASGLDWQGATGMNVGINPGIAIGPTGDLLISPNVITIAIPQAVSNPRRDLIVIRANPVNDVMITRPTSPSDIVPLTVEMEASVIAITGVEASTPVYPATGASDVVLMGIRVTPAATSVQEYDIDYHKRDSVGKHTLIAQSLPAWDDRARVYVKPGSSNTVGIKPAQTTNGRYKNFLYTGSARPSIFPKQSSAFVEQDTFINFETGVITGGDTTTTSPLSGSVVPSAGKTQCVTLSLTTSDTLAASFGLEGTYRQAKQGMINQQTGGAGQCLSTNNYKLAYVFITSSDGSHITEIEVVDARGMGNSFIPVLSGSVKRITNSDSPYTVLTSDSQIEIDASSGNVTLTLPDRGSNQASVFDLDRVDSSGNTVTIQRAGSDTFGGGSTSYTLDDQFQAVRISAGTTYWKIR